MFDCKKLSIINTIDKTPILSNKNYLILKRYALDDDAFVRSSVARTLVHFVNEQTKTILLELTKDKEALVRVEAIDSLSVYHYHDVERVLKKIIIEEQDDLARSYAILSWSDVTNSLNNDCASKRFLYQWLEKEKCEDCILSCYYGLYLFGEESYLNQIFDFLKKDDYHLRCSAIHLLDSLLRSKNKIQIKNELNLLLEYETSVAVKEGAKQLLRQINE